jgi:multidrug efflux pump subunit AcrB
MTPLIRSPRNRILFFIGVVVLLLVSVALVPLGLVKVKMLPFDNKSELQVSSTCPTARRWNRRRAWPRRLAMNLRGSRTC